MKTALLDVLIERGFIKDISDERGVREALAKPMSVYCGYDPTAPSLHVGHLLSIMTLGHIQAAGHRPIVVVGGGTGLIGDPSGKPSQRRVLTRKTVRSNLTAMKTQFARFLRFENDDALILDNADWLEQLRHIEFLRDIGSHFTVNQLLQHQTYRNRVASDGLSFVEFSYVLVQAYDFLRLRRDFGCLLQIGGSDQWFNILAGIDLIRKVDGEKAFGLVSPLSETSSGGKMGKTERGAICLDPTLTTPFEYYQFWINTSDADVGRFLRLFTFLPIDRIRELEQLNGASTREAKAILAFESSRLCHGDRAAVEVEQASRQAFAGSLTEAIPTVPVSAVLLAHGVRATELFVLTGLCASRGAARRLIDQGGASINNKRIASQDEMVNDRSLVGGAIVLRSGKKQLRRIVPA